MALGDALPEPERAQYINSRLVVGRIIRVYLSLTKGPKIKFFLITHVGSEIAGLIINTKINEFKQNNQALLECQVEIDVANHDGLDYDCFIDCSQVHYEDAAGIKAQLMADVGGIRNMLSDDVRAAVIAAITDSYVMEKYEKQRVLQALQALT